MVGWEFAEFVGLGLAGLGGEWHFDLEKIRQWVFICVVRIFGGPIQWPDGWYREI